MRMLAVLMHSQQAAFVFVWQVHEARVAIGGGGSHAAARTARGGEGDCKCTLWDGSTWPRVLTPAT